MTAPLGLAAASRLLAAGDTSPLEVLDACFSNLDIETALAAALRLP
jgi:hypothetical protein